MTPPDDLMESFYALARAVFSSTAGGVLEVLVPADDGTGDAVAVTIPDEHLDELFRVRVKGQPESAWLVNASADGDECVATPTGLYWLNKWAAKNKKERRAAPRVAAVRRRLFGRKRAR